MANEKAQASRTRRSLEEAIAYQQAKLRTLQTKRQDQQRRERERNQRAVMQLIQAEGLDRIPAQKWKIALSEIKGLLTGE